MAIKKSADRLSVTIKGGRGGSLEVARNRIWIMKIFFVALYLVVALRLFDLMIIQNDAVDTNNAIVRDVAIKSSVGDSEKRADITDRNGVLLATSLKTASVYADPKNVLYPKETALALTKIFPDLSYEVVLKKLNRSGRFIWIKRGVVPEDQVRVLEIGDPGLAFRNEYKRIYPQGNVSAHVVGYSNIDGKGVMGIERSFQEVLSDPALKDDSIRTTLDVRLQNALYAELQKTKNKFDAHGASGMIIDARRGDVLAMVSLPDFDPHSPMSTNKKYQFNSATLGTYELGSVFKIFSTAALLETQENALSMSFDATEPLKPGRFTINDYHGEERSLTVPEVFMVSSNIGQALMSEVIGTEGLKSFYKKLGLFDKPDVSFMELGKPQFPKPWRDINTLTASYGHGIAVSPLQLVSAVATVVNGGYKVSPRFVVPKEDGNEQLKARIISGETSDVMRSLMRLVVTDGTAKKAGVDGYGVGGKTGTAEKPGKKGYDRKRLISSFVGAFPIDDPEYVIFTMLDEPKGIKESYGYATAGWTAAPTFSNVVKRIASINAILPNAFVEKAKEGKQGVSDVSYRGGL